MRLAFITHHLLSPALTMRQRTSRRACSLVVILLSSLLLLDSVVARPLVRNIRSTHGKSNNVLWMVGSFVAARFKYYLYYSLFYLLIYVSLFLLLHQNSIGC